MFGPAYVGHPVTMYLRYALVVSLSLHAATLWWLVAGPRYSDRAAPDVTAAKPEALSVGFQTVPPAVAKEIFPESVEKVPLRADKFFPASQVEESARPLNLKPLIIPERAYMERIRGKVRLRIYIDKGGKVDRVDVLQSEPVGIFEQSAIEAVTASRFIPARIRGMPVNTFKDIEIEIDPYETIGLP